MRRNNATLNGQLARVISETGHTDQIVVTDAGLPIPSPVELAYPHFLTFSTSCSTSSRSKEQL